jgi:hypothetical protein
MRTATGGPSRGWWLPRRNRRSRRAPTARTASSQTTAGAIQLAIGLLTASLDSPELHTWAVRTLVPEDPEGLGDLLAGLHIVSQLLVHQLHEATGEPPTATLRRIAVAAEAVQDAPPAG